MSDKDDVFLFSLQYHLVLSSKNRKNIFFTEEIRTLLKDNIKEISFEFEVTIMDIVIVGARNRVHITFTAHQTLSLPKYIKTLRTIIAREIRRSFPEVKEKLDGGQFWASGYSLNTMDCELGGIK